MKKVISIMIAALMSAASWAQVNPKINQLFEELKQTKGALYPTAPSIMKRGGMDNFDNHPQLDYSLQLYYRPDLIRGRKDSLFVDSILRVDKACLDKRVKAIRRTISEMQKEAQDSLVDISQSDLPWTEKERPKKVMPPRPKEIGSTEVQLKRYRERASAISFAGTAKNAHLKNCRATGRQDVVYGDQGASVYWQGGIIGGSVDFIFGAMTLCADNTTLVANVTNEKNDNCYIAAGRSGSPDTPSRGMLFYKCHIRYATEDELDSGPFIIDRVPNRPYLARPWRWWGETVWAYTTWDFNLLNLTGWSTGLVKDKEGFNPENPCPYSYEYKSQDGSVGRPKWVSVLRKPILPDGTKLTPKDWLK
jgi:hypothetical protein